MDEQEKLIKTVKNLCKIIKIQQQEIDILTSWADYLHEYMLELESNQKSGKND